MSEITANQKVGVPDAHGISFNEALLVWMREWRS
ncbi:hypothetical protein ACVWWO_005357 [Bradyrhizobium sp. F1.13.1]